MSFMVSEEVTVKEGGPRMIVTGYSSGMVGCASVCTELPDATLSRLIMPTL